jgi:hercynylcysteine S-oxide lyase
MTPTAAALDVRWQNWAERRTPFAGLHLDTAAGGRTSSAVRQAMTAHLRREAEAGVYVAEGETARTVDDGRAALADLLGVPADGLAFVESASAALQALLLSWPLSGDASVAVAPSEWWANVRAFRMRGLTIKLLPVDADGVIDVQALGSFLAANRPSIVHVNQVAAHHGLVQPVDEIVQVCRASDVPIWIDAAQSLGQVNARSDADAVFATSRKWLCGPRGAGVLGVAERWWARLRTQPLALRPDRPIVARLEPDEANIAGRIGLSIAVGEYLADGETEVQRRLAKTGELTRRALEDVPGWHLLPSPSPSQAIVALQPTNGQDVVAERARLLAEHRILVTASTPQRAPLEAIPPALRISPHVDVTTDQLEQLEHALRINSR